MRLPINASVCVFEFKMYTFGTLHRESAQLQDTHYLLMADSQQKDSKVRAIQIIALKPLGGADS